MPFMNPRGFKPRRSFGNPRSLAPLEDTYPDESEPIPFDPPTEESPYDDNVSNDPTHPYPQDPTPIEPFPEPPQPPQNPPITPGPSPIFTPPPTQSPTGPIVQPAPIRNRSNRLGLKQPSSTYWRGFGKLAGLGPSSALGGGSPFGDLRIGGVNDSDNPLTDRRRGLLEQQSFGLGY